MALVYLIFLVKPNALLSFSVKIIQNIGFLSTKIMKFPQGSFLGNSQNSDSDKDVLYFA